MAFGTEYNIADKLAHTNKFIIGFMVLAASAIIGSVGLAGATHSPNPGHSKEACKNGGWQALGYRNQGQCVSAAARAQHGNGYGG